MSDTLLFDAACNRLVPAMLKKYGSPNGERTTATSYVVFLDPVNKDDFLDVEHDATTGIVTVHWRDTEIVMRPNKCTRYPDATGYHSFITFTTRSDATANEHATIDSMIEQACSVNWDAY